RNQDHRNMFAIGTGDAVDGAKCSDTVCHNHRADAVDSRVRIRRVGGVKLAAVSNPGRLTAVFELLHESQVVIAGNTKQVANTSLLQAAKQKVPNGLFHNECLHQPPETLVLRNSGPSANLAQST